VNDQRNIFTFKKTIGADNNYVATPLFEKALEMARSLDKERQNLLSAGKAVPALHGIPISVKEMLKVEGVRYTCGYASSLVKNLIAETDSVFVRLLRDQGCIPLVTSNVPQGLFSLETRNQIYGIGRQKKFISFSIKII
jgi:amidase